MSALSASEITAAFLYGKHQAPSSLVDEGLIRAPQGDPSLEVEPIVVDVNEYMAGAGRFALATMSSLVRHFFSPIKGDPFVGPGSYTKEELADLLGITKYGISFQQYDYDDGKADYTERTFVWNSSKFKLADDVVFVVDEFGNRTIENFAIVPDGPENFDFVTNDPLFQLFADYLKARMDPSDLGRTVDILFTDYTGPRTTYTLDNYYTDVVRNEEWFTGPQLRLWPETDDILDDLFADGVTKFLDGNKPILYGTTGDDEVTAADVGDYPYLEPYEGNGVVILGAAGDDTLTGGDSSDKLIGGIDADYLDGA